MRARLIKPGFYKSDELADLPPLARILFSGLWCLADRAGRLKDRPRTIKAEVLPYDECDIDAFLDALAMAGFIVRYGNGRNRYIQVVNFGKHQTPHVNERPSPIPAPDVSDTSPILVEKCIADPDPDPDPVPEEEAPTSVGAAAAPPPPRPDLRKPKDREKGWIEQHPLFQATVDLFGKPVGDQWALRARCLREFDELGATSDDLRYRHGRYPVVMGKDKDGTPMALTLPALIKHWHLCAPPAVNGRARAPAEPPPRSNAETAELRRRILAGEDIE